MGGNGSEEGEESRTSPGGAPSMKAEASSVVDAML